MTPEQVKTESHLRIRKALEHIQQAQNELGSACAELSSITGGVTVWRTTSKLYDSVHALWYRVEDFRMRGKFGLDSLSTEALKERLRVGS